MHHNAVKRIGFLVKKAAMSQEQFENYWLNKHAELCKSVPHVLRYSINLVDRQRFPQLGYDGISEIWFKSEAALAAALASSEGKTLLGDSANFAERGMSVFAREFQIIWN
ncbi:EthD family reductase [Diaphorobacter sp. HDW4A]|uniref:EthD family reductase n=1 Tax=Diaphorobacter sp. HDW4A TaxID=2714924 RepID=UPI00140E7301|nr:EthD family reductase [Diaphorobacter sp. HDW4A]QIL79960.1 EthD family reductase [Diaphorobacter sp. HDW4A]